MPSPSPHASPPRARGSLAGDLRPAVPGSLATLGAASIDILIGGGGFTPHPPLKGDFDDYPWHAAINALP